MLASQLLDDRNAEDNAEDAVEGSGVGDGVEMRANEEARRIGR